MTCNIRVKDTADEAVYLRKVRKNCIKQRKHIGITFTGNTISSYKFVISEATNNGGVTEGDNTGRHINPKGTSVSRLYQSRFF